MTNYQEVFETYCIIVVTYNRLQLLEECLNCIDNLSVLPEKVIVVDNASSDGTEQFLFDKAFCDSHYLVKRLESNMGGAGGFAQGLQMVMKLVHSGEVSSKSVLLIDDDVMLRNDYMELLLHHKKKHSECKAFAGTVMVHKENQLCIDTYHRRNLRKLGLYAINCPTTEYDKDFFCCDIVSFCGVLLDLELIEEIGLPHSEYFIWHDDFEYSIRMQPYTKVCVVPNAKLLHKTKNYEQEYPRKYDWREYYAIRNRIFYLREHGTLPDRIINGIDMFVNIRLRNTLFGFFKVGRYDWKYEKMLVKRARQDAKREDISNPIIMREKQK